MSNTVILNAYCKNKFSVHTSIRSSKQNLSTYYDTLNLKPGCTKKEIRNSFIKLSKLVSIFLGIFIVKLQHLLHLVKL